MRTDVRRGRARLPLCKHRQQLRPIDGAAPVRVTILEDKAHIGCAGERHQHSGRAACASRECNCRGTGAPSLAATFGAKAFSTESNSDESRVLEPGMETRSRTKASRLARGTGLGWATRRPCRIGRRARRARFCPSDSSCTFAQSAQQERRPHEHCGHRGGECVHCALSVEGLDSRLDGCRGWALQ